MLKNIGKLIHFVAIALAVVFFAAFLGFGVACLLAATAEGVDEALKTAGFQGAVLSFVLALVAPLFCVVAYGFGSLIIATERNAQDVREMKEKLHAALTEGLLSDEDITTRTDVLNGIAYDAATKRIFVTGKRWNKLFEIEIVKR
jgi:hypothetical protein